jgi:hypothetical protein
MGAFEWYVSILDGIFGGLAAVFPAIAVVESDFSVLSLKRSSLPDLSLGKKELF